MLAEAERAARIALSSHVDAEGRVLHAAGSGEVIHLADGAVFRWALTRLGEATGEATYLEAAERIAAALDRMLRARGGAFWAHTPDPGAAGVLLRRRKRHEANVYAARLLAALDRQGRRPEGEAMEVLAAISDPSALQSQGRMVGPYLVALDEVGALRWHRAVQSAP